MKRVDLLADPPVLSVYKERFRFVLTGDLLHLRQNHSGGHMR